MAEGQQSEERLTAPYDPREFAKKWLRENKRKLYSQLRRDGELDEFLDTQVERVWDVTRSLLRSGVFNEQAFQWAVRSEIYGAEWD